MIDIKKYKNYYQINEKGKIISLDRKIPNSIGDGFRVFKGRMLKKAIASNGYYSVCLSKNGKCKTHFIHRLLCEHFKPNPLNLRCINHKDGNKLNNDLDNLEWCTYSENMNHAVNTGLTKTVGETNIHAKLTNFQVNQIKQLLRNEIEQKIIAKMFNVSRSTISQINSNKTWKQIN